MGPLGALTPKEIRRFKGTIRVESTRVDPGSDLSFGTTLSGCSFEPEDSCHKSASTVTVYALRLKVRRANPMRPKGIGR